MFGFRLNKLEYNMKIIIIYVFLISTFCFCTNKKIGGPTENGGRYECECDDKVFNGLCEFYDSTNNLIGLINYKNGIREGSFKDYYADGKLKEEGNYHMDGTQNLSHYDRNGVLNWMYLSKDKWVVFKYYKDRSLFIERYRHGDSLTKKMVIDSIIYHVDNEKLKYKYTTFNEKMYKCYNNACIETERLGNNEDEFIKIILGKDTSRIYYKPDPMPTMEWFY